MYVQFITKAKVLNQGNQKGIIECPFEETLKSLKDHKPTYLARLILINLKADKNVLKIIS